MPAHRRPSTLTAPRGIEAFGDWRRVPRGRRGPGAARRWRLATSFAALVVIVDLAGVNARPPTAGLTGFAAPAAATTGLSASTPTDAATPPPAAVVPDARSFTSVPTQEAQLRRATFTSNLPDQRARIAIATAMAQIGLPYVWGGDGPDAGDAGFDCSGLTTFSYAAANVNLPRTAHTQYYTGPHVAAGAALQPGDLVFYGTAARVHHVGMYIGDGRMVNAPTFGKPVRTAYYRWTGDDYLGASRPAATGLPGTGLPPYIPAPAPADPSPGATIFAAPEAPLPATPLPAPTDPQPPEAVTAAEAVAEAPPVVGPTEAVVGPTTLPPTTATSTTAPATSPPATTTPGATAPAATPDREGSSPSSNPASTPTPPAPTPSAPTPAAPTTSSRPPLTTSTPPAPATPTDAPATSGTAGNLTAPVPATESSVAGTSAALKSTGVGADGLPVSAGS